MHDLCALPTCLIVCMPPPHLTTCLPTCQSRYVEHKLELDGIKATADKMQAALDNTHKALHAEAARRMALEEAAAVARLEASRAKELAAAVAAERCVAARDHAQATSDWSDRYLDELGSCAECCLQLHARAAVLVMSAGCDLSVGVRQG